MGDVSMFACIAGIATYARPASVCASPGYQLFSVPAFEGFSEKILARLVGDGFEFFLKRFIPASRLAL